MLLPVSSADLIDTSCSPLHSSLACKTSAKLFCVIFSSCSVSRDPFGLMVVQWGPGCVLQTMTCVSPTTQKLMCYPNNFLSPLYYTSTYSHVCFTEVLCQQKFLCGDCSPLCSCYQCRAQSFQNVWQIKQVLSSPIHQPDVRLTVSTVSSLNRIMHGQGVLFNRATVPTAISPETFHKFN